MSRIRPSPFERALDDSPLVLDPGLATALEAAGHDLDDPLWSARTLLEDPDALEAAHRSFAAAGVDIITTGSYQASLPGLRARGLSRAAAMATLRKATELARRATEGAAHRVFVAASAGSYGAHRADGSEYRGNYGVSTRALVDFHTERLDAFADADVVAFETIPDLQEAQAIAQAVLTLPAGLPAWVSFVGRDAERVGGGERIEACVAAVADAPSVVAVGVNCTAPHHVASLLRRAATVTDKPLVAYPNSGEHYDGRWSGLGTPPRSFEALARQWIGDGARIVGGCCRTDIRHIRALHRALRRGPA